MPDIIELLPDAVANQIAAGEVIQRPASVVKELVENAVDAGADEIKVIIKDAGKTLIQVVDNGMGMTETDARLAFERHATSKIRSADDLFHIRTKGFRGEALASIASIAHVCLKTKQGQTELGTLLELAGSKVEKQEPTSCAGGSNFIVKNLFYNVPARRKFLKSNTTEFKHIINEFQRVALTHPEIHFMLTHNDQSVYNLPSSNLRQRIVHVFGKQSNQNLTNIESETTLIKIRGFVGKPEFARKTSGEQYFFINQRYMRHPYFHRAVMNAYSNILAPDTYPSYFLFFEIDPSHVDVNIHPTKTEIKFENEQALFQIIQASVKEALGKTNVMPSIDFDTHGVVDIPVLGNRTEVSAPQIPINPNFNPFDMDKPKAARVNFGSNRAPSQWESLYEGLEQNQANFEQEGQNQLFDLEAEEAAPTQEQQTDYLQVKGKFILTSVKSGLMLIDQKRAHERILYEEFIRNMALNQAVSQKSLYPEQIELSPDDHLLACDMLDDLNALGFDISNLGGNSIAINGIPDLASQSNPKQLLEELLEEFKETQQQAKCPLKEKLAISLAAASAIPYGKKMQASEMQHLVDSLFACENPNYSPTGKKTIAMMRTEELEQLLN